MFLSADLGAMQEARDIGFAQSATLFFEKSGAGSVKAFESLSKQMVEYRSGVKSKFAFDADDQPKDDGDDDN